MQQSVLRSRPASLRLVSDDRTECWYVYGTDYYCVGGLHDGTSIPRPDA